MLTPVPDFRGNTADAESQWGTQGAQLLMKARQEDYWNKIAIYNTKISQLEKQEAALKKKNDQARMRQ